MAEHAPVLALPADATQPGDIARLVDLALIHFGRIDVLINNAGILGPSPRPNMGEFAAVDLADLFRANVIGSMLMTQAVLPHMLVQKSGLIINIT